MKIFTLIAYLAALSGCASIYLASPNQRWLVRSLPVVPARTGGVLLLVLGWLSLLQKMQSVTAAFVFITFLMLVFSVLPYIGALVGNGRER